MTGPGRVGLNVRMEDDHPDMTDLPWPLTGADALRDELLAAYGEPTLSLIHI